MEWDDCILTHKQTSILYVLRSLARFEQVLFRNSYISYTKTATGFSDPPVAVSCGWDFSKDRRAANLRSAGKIDSNFVSRHIM